MRSLIIKPSIKAALSLVFALQCWFATGRADIVDEELPANSTDKRGLNPEGVEPSPGEELKGRATQGASNQASQIKSPLPHAKEQKSSSTTTVIPPKSGGRSVSTKRRAGAAKSPVHFESMGLKGLREKGMVELSQDVLVTQEDLKLESDYAQVFFDEASHEVTRVVAQGHVRINGVDQNSGEKFRALGDRAVFLNSERTVVMDGNAKLWRGEDSVIRSKKITYEMNTGWVRADRVAGEVQTDSRGTETSKNPPVTTKGTEKRK
ncbi:MAG: hypothetical protein FJ146_03670 [Deltaproteobacteria bacterium]|nr:hypothetical protein [Deltaproteobacteria bacterium]